MYDDNIMKKSSRFYLKYNPDNRWSFWTGKWWSLCSEISGQFTPKLGGQFDRLFHISLGFMYTLPMLVNFQAEVYHDGIVRLSLMREDIPITKRLRAGFMVNTDMEYMTELKYIINKNVGIRTHYDSDMGWGAGITLMY